MSEIPMTFNFVADSKPKKKKKKTPAKRNFKKYTADGFPIYKMWKGWGPYYDVLAKNPETGMWVYGRNYKLSTGRWAGGTYRPTLKLLYERSPPFGKLVVDNKRGYTGRY